MLIGPVDTSFQQSLVYAPLRQTEERLFDPDRPRGVTVDTLQQPEAPQEALKSRRDIMRHRLGVESEADSALAERSSGEPRQDASRLLFVEAAPLFQPRNLNQFAEKPSAADRLLQSNFGSTSEQTSTSERANENRAETPPQERRQSVFEFIRNDFAIELNDQRDPELAASRSLARDTSIALERPADPSNFDNFVVTVGKIERNEARVLGQPRSANDLETPIDDLDNPNRQFAVKPYSPAEFAEFRVFEERGQPNPTERTGDNDFSERPTNMDVINQVAEFANQQDQRLNPARQDASIQSDLAALDMRSRSAIDSTQSARSASPTDSLPQLTETRTFAQAPANTTTGLNTNPNPFPGAETATTGFRDIVEPEARRPRIVQALLGTPENLLERARVVNQMPVRAEEASGLTPSKVSDMLGLVPASVPALGGYQREAGEVFDDAEPVSVKSSRELQTNPGPVSAERSEELNQEHAEKIRRDYYERITFTYNEIARAQDFINSTEPRAGRSFYYFV